MNRLIMIDQPFILVAHSQKKIRVSTFHRSSGHGAPQRARPVPIPVPIATEQRLRFPQDLMELDGPLWRLPGLVNIN